MLKTVVLREDSQTLATDSIFSDAHNVADIPHLHVRSPLIWLWSAISLLKLRTPWTLAKDPAERSMTLDQSALPLAESLRIIAILISPVLPKAAHGIFDQLNWKMELSGKEERFSLADAEWGRLPDGHVVGKPMPLFPRIEIREGV